VASGVGSGKGIEWLLSLDANTRGAVEVIEALNKSRSAADVAGAAIDRALAKMDKLPGHSELKSRLSAENAGWDAAIRGAKGRIAAEEATNRSIRNRTSMLALETHEMRANGEVAQQSTESLWSGVLKGEIAMEGLRIGAEMAFEAVKKTAEVLWDAVKAAGGSERTSKVFENMLGKEGGKDTLEYLDQFAGLSEFTDDTLKPMAAALLQVGVRGADFRNAIAASVDVAAQSTDKVAGFSGAMESFTRIARTGRVDNRILGGLALNPHDVEAQLAKDLRLTPETIKKKLEEGTLKGVEAMDSIFTVMEAKSGKQLGALGLEMANNLDSRLDKLRNVPDEIYKKLKDTQGFEDISETVGKITELLSPESKIGERLFTALEKMIDIVGKRLTQVDWDHVADQITKVVEKVADLVGPLIKVADLVLKVGDYATKPTRTITGMAMSAIGAPLEFGASMLGKLTGVSDSERQEVLDEMIAKNERAWKESGADQALAQQAGYKEANDQHSPSRVWMGLGEQTMEGLRLGIESGAPGAQGAAAAAISPPAIGGFGGGSVGGGSLRIEAGAIVITVVASGGSPQESGRDAAEQISSTLLPMLEQFAIQAGLA
jgi:hypothetical protein